MDVSGHNQIVSSEHSADYEELMEAPERFEEGLCLAEAAEKAAKNDLQLIKANLARIWFVSKIPDREQEALKLCDAVIEQYFDRNDEVAPYVAAAMSNKGWLLAWIERNYSSAMAQFDQVVERFGTSSSPDVEAKVLGATVNKGWILYETNRLTEAVECFDWVIDRIDNRRNPQILPQLANAKINKAQAIAAMNEERLVEAKKLCMEILEDFGAFGDRQYEEALTEAREFLAQ